MCVWLAKRKNRAPLFTPLPPLCVWLTLHAWQVIDFGLSKKYVPESPHLVDGVGTIYTMAPQVLQGMYTSQADLWSVGVISYMLLCGDMPFSGRKRRHVIDKIMRCSYGFSNPRWKNHSKESIDFVKGLIEMNPKNRWNADVALSSKWMAKKFDINARKPDDSLLAGAASSLQRYGQHGQLAKMALMVIAHQSTTEEVSPGGTSGVLSEARSAQTRPSTVTSFVASSVFYYSLATLLARH